MYRMTNEVARQFFDLLENNSDCKLYFAGAFAYDILIGHDLRITKKYFGDLYQKCKSKECKRILDSLPCGVDLTNFPKIVGDVHQFFKNSDIAPFEIANTGKYKSIALELNKKLYKFDLVETSHDKLYLVIDEIPVTTLGL